MRRLHLMIGVLALAMFAATGMVMRTHNPRLRLLGDDVRLMYRSRHIYIFASGMANVLLGVYLVPAQLAFRRGLQWGGSALFIAAPVFLTAAFFLETQHGLSSNLWLSELGLDSLLAGTILHFVSAIPWPDTHA